MLTRILTFFVMALAIILLSCSDEQKVSQDNQPLQQAAPADSLAAADTTLAGRYFNKAEQFAKEAKYDSAIVYFEKASVLYEAQENWEKYVRCYNKMGEQCGQKRKLDQAMEYLNHALKIGLTRLGEQHSEIAASYHNLGTASLWGGKYNQAIKHLNQAISLRRRLLGEQHSDVAASYSSMGIAYWYKGDYEQALSFSDKALSIQLATLGEQHNSVAATLINMGAVYSKKGDFDQALNFYIKALSILQAIQGEQHPMVAASYNNIGIVYYDQADYDQALVFHKKALSIRRAMFGEQHPFTAASYNNIGIVYLEKGDYDQAIGFFQKSLSIKLATLERQHPDIAINYINMGNVYLNKGDYDQAVAYHKKALSIRLAKLGEQHPEVAMTYLNMGKVYHGRGEYDLAIVFFRKSLSINLAALGEQHPYVAESYIGMGNFYQKTADYDRAIDSYQQAIRANVPRFIDSDPYVNPPLDSIISETLLLKSLEGKGEALANFHAKQPGRLKVLEAAVSTYHHASKLIDQMRSGYKAEGSKLVLAENATDIYDKAIQTALRLHDFTHNDEHQNTAFLFAEKSKAGVLLEALSEAKAKQFAGIPDSLLERERELRIDLAFYDQSLTEEKLKRTDTDSAKIALWQDKVFSLKRDYDALLQRFENDYPDYYNLKYQVKTVSVQDVQQQILDDNTALVEYFTGQDSIFIFAITRDEFDVVAVAKDSLFEQQVRQLRSSMIDSLQVDRKDVAERSFARYMQSAYHLYQSLLEPVADKISGKKLIIVPDGVLNNIPFEALLTKAVSTEGDLKKHSELPYLVKEHAVSYAYSATLLHETLKRKRTKAGLDYLAFAPVFPNGLADSSKGAAFLAQNLADDSTFANTRASRYALLASATEVTGILNLFDGSYGFLERLFRDKSHAYLEDQATEEKVKAPNLADYRFVHFATHGAAKADPKLSGILMASPDPDASGQNGAADEDGILHLGEVYNLNLNADLVVLSACETGRGEIKKGEGIIGLTRGFLYAGASNLLVSLWQVDDVATAKLMVDFYDRMLDGMSKTEALQQAKLQMLQENPEQAMPYYWSAFILIGR